MFKMFKKYFSKL